MASVRRMHVFVLTVLLLNSLNVVSSLYFHMGETEEKCFIQELPKSIVLSGHFQTQLLDKQQRPMPDTQDTEILIVASDPDKVVLFRLYGSEGSFNFTSEKPGEHQICLQSNSSARGLLTVHLDFRVGKYTNKLTELQQKVHDLTTLVLKIQREHNHKKLREEYFCEVMHNTDMWIFWWPVIRSLYVVGFIMWFTKSW